MSINLRMNFIFRVWSLFSNSWMKWVKESAGVFYKMSEFFLGRMDAGIPSAVPEAAFLIRTEGFMGIFLRTALKAALISALVFAGCASDNSSDSDIDSLTGVSISGNEKVLIGQSATLTAAPKKQENLKSHIHGAFRRTSARR